MTVAHNNDNHTHNNDAVIAECDGSQLIKTGRDLLFDRGGRTYKVRNHLHYGWGVITADRHGSQICGGRASAEEAFTDACRIIDRKVRRESQERSADAALYEAWPEPPKSPVEALRHVLDLSRHADDDFAVRATSEMYDTAPVTGLTYGDLKALLHIIEQSS